LATFFSSNANLLSSLAAILSSKAALRASTSCSKLVANFLSSFDCNLALAILVGVETESHKEVQLADKETQVVLRCAQSCNFSISLTLVFIRYKGKLLAGRDPNFSP
jgi:hypothetical protein